MEEAAVLAPGLAVVGQHHHGGVLGQAGLLQGGDDLADPAVDIATLAAEIVRIDERTNPHVVKVIGTTIAAKRLRALYFTRATAPAGEGPLYHHIGIYAYRRPVLDRFVSLPPSPLERREKLEQLRMLQSGGTILVAVVEHATSGIDTPADYAAFVARRRAG